MANSTHEEQGLLPLGKDNEMAKSKEDDMAMEEIIDAIGDKKSHQLKTLLEKLPKGSSEKMKEIEALGHLVENIESNDISDREGEKAHMRILRRTLGVPKALKYCKDVTKFVELAESANLSEQAKTRIEGSKKSFIESADSVKRDLMIIISAFALFILLILVTVICASLGSGSHRTIPEEDTCKDPHKTFTDLHYVVNESDVLIKYKIIGNAQKFSMAKEACKELGAELWEVLDGKPEWEALSTELKKADQDLAAWINGEIEECPQGEKCKSTDAAQGLGIPMKRSKTQRYSRLYGDETGDKCVTISGDIWLRRNCESRGIPVCILRGCKVIQE